MNKMKLFLTAMICFLAIGLSAQSPVGKWKFQFETPDGKLVIAADIKADGTYALDMGNDGSTEVNGTYSMSARYVLVYLSISSVGFHHLAAPKSSAT